jgi:glutamate/tyrosine decarboxylase-like PLP-dependent enzyme
MSTRDLLRRTADLAADYLESLPERPVGLPVPVTELRQALGGPLPERGQEPRRVVEDLIAGAERGIMASSGPRFFGFVVGGSLPASLAADWLATAWDQNAGIYVLAPAASVVEEVAGGWLKELLGLPADASVGFVTGCQAANFSGIAAGRHELLRRAGWDVERRGLYGAPPIEVVIGAEAHVTIDAALQMLGLGRERVHRVAADGQGRMDAAALARLLASPALHGRPALVCAQAGNVNTGAFDPIAAIAAACRGHGNSWLHIDGAFGLWAHASPAQRQLTNGIALADSWATDGHKWLNVPYDSGLVFCAHPDAHRAAFTANATYLQKTAGAERDPEDWTPEFSRRARGFAVWAALRSLGRQGVADLVEGCCAHARRFAEVLGAEAGIEVLNDVVLNQALIRFHPLHGGDAAAIDAFTRDTVRRVQESGELWLSGTTWQGKAAMRISVSGWMTTTADIDRSVAAIRRAALRA